MKFADALALAGRLYLLGQELEEGAPLPVNLTKKKNDQKRYFLRGTLGIEDVPPGERELDEEE